MRSTARWVAGLAATLILAGCGTSGPATPREVKEVKGGGGELRVLLPGEPGTLNPDLPRDEMALIVGQSLFNRLVSLDADNRLIPELAESWEVSPDARTYTFRLRRGVRWHDGKPFTADDVQWTLAELGRLRPAADAVARIARVETAPGRVTVRLAEPWAPFLPTLAATGTYILPRHLHAGRTLEAGPAGEKPVGTGPFKLQEWVKGERLTLAANPRYFRRGPYLDRVTFRFVADSDRATEALRRGKADLIFARPRAELLPALQATPGLEIQIFPSEARYYCGFNLRRRPFQDRRVRAAVNGAIDRPELVERALGGYGAPAFGFYTPTVAWAYNGQARVPPFDPGHAAELLDQAGLPPGRGGVRFTAVLVAPGTSPFLEIARTLERQLAEVGIALRIESVPLREWLARVLRDHDFDLALMAGSQGPDPENLQIRFGSRGSSQFMGYSSPELDAVLAEGARHRDLGRRAAAYFRAQEILARDLPVAPLAEAVRLSTHRSNVLGLPQTGARGLVATGDYSLVRLAPRASP